MSVAADILNARSYASTVLSNATNALSTAMAAATALGTASSGLGAGVTSFNVGFNGMTATSKMPVIDAALPPFVAFSTQAGALGTINGIALTGAPGTPPVIAKFVDPVEVRPDGAAGDVRLLTGIPSPTDIDIIDPVNLLQYIDSIPVPTIHEIYITPSPTYSPPQFLGTSPMLPGDAPTDLDVTMREQYATISPIMLDAIRTEIDSFIDARFPGFTAGLSAIEDRLTTYLAGGTALTAEVQDAIFERAANKADAEYRRLRYGAFAEGALAGHTIPSAILLAKVTSADKARRDANFSVSRDLMIKIADMEQQNMQFAVTQSLALRGVMLTAATQYYTSLVQVNGQALDYARSVVDVVAKVYELSIRQSETQVRIYESEAQIYDSKTKGALAQMEAYAQEIKGLEAIASLDIAQATVYRSRLEAVQAQATAYKAYTDSLLAQVGIERMKVEIYQAKVQAYAAQVSAYTARWNGYKAAVDGRTSAVTASAEAVRGYVGQTQAFQAIIAARTAAIDATAKRNEGVVRVFESQVKAYSAQTEAEGMVARAKLDYYTNQIRAFEAEQSALTENNKALVAAHEASTRLVIAAADIQVRGFEAQGKLDIAKVEALTRLGSIVAQAYAGVAQAALAGLNTLSAQIENSTV